MNTWLHNGYGVKIMNLLETAILDNKDDGKIHVLKLILSAQDLEEIKKMATELGVDPSTMARILIKEAIKARKIR